MANLYTVSSKYIIIVCMAIYAVQCFAALKARNKARENAIFNSHTISIFVVYVAGIINVFLNNSEDLDLKNQTIILIGAELIYLIVMLIIFPVVYPNANRLILSNMSMLLSIGFIMIARLNFQKSIKQFAIVAAVSLLSMIVPYLLSHFTIWKNFTYFYCIFGLVLLLAVIINGNVTNGSLLSINIGGFFTFQPSEFVKIIFVFFLAGMLDNKPDFKRVCLAALLSGTYVIVLVLSKDLGSALIFFMVFAFMLYVATKKKIYLFLCAFGGCFAAILGYKLFSHVQIRVTAWLDPWSTINNEGYQVARSLFAIASGGFTGTGLYQGLPSSIPEVMQDFIFSAIAEEMGGIVAMLIVLVCFSCFVAFMQTAMNQLNSFNKLVAFGLGISYAVQTILTIGGALKMIPSTGVTLPLISYGGSSILSTLITFSIVQGLAITGTENSNLRRKKLK